MVIGHNNPAPSKRVFVLDQQSIGATVEPPLLAVEAQRQSVLVPTRTQTTLDEREYDKDGNQELVPAENWDRANVMGTCSKLTGSKIVPSSPFSG